MTTVREKFLKDGERWMTMVYKHYVIYPLIAGKFLLSIIEKIRSRKQTH